MGEGFAILYRKTVDWYKLVHYAINWVVKSYLGIDRVNLNCLFMVLSDGLLLHQFQFFKAIYIHLESIGLNHFNGALADGHKTCDVRAVTTKQRGCTFSTTT